MRNARKLTLKREALTPLSTGEMSAVAGGSHVCGLTDGCTHGPSIDQTCPTVPPTTCVVISDPNTFVRTLC